MNALQNPPAQPPSSRCSKGSCVLYRGRVQSEPKEHETAALTAAAVTVLVEILPLRETKIFLGDLFSYSFEKQNYREKTETEILHHLVYSLSAMARAELIRSLKLPLITPMGVQGPRT